MNRFLLGCGIALAIIGCKDKKSDPPPAPEPAKTPPADKPPVDKPPAAPTGFAKTDLGRVGTSTTAEDDPRLVIDSKNRPVVGYKSANKNHVVRWDAGAWKPVGGPVECKSDLEKYAIADADGSVIVAGTINDSKGTHYARACVTRETAEGWKIIGEPFGDDAKYGVGIGLVTGAQGPIVVLHQRAVGDESTLEIRRLDGEAWKPVGDGKAPVTKGADIASFRVASVPDGMVVAWREKSAGKPALLAVQKLAYADWKWTALPEIKDVDADTSFEIAGAPDGSVLVARTWNPGFKEVLRWMPGTPAWASHENPGKREFTAHDPPAIAAGPKNEAVLAWAGNLVEASIHDGKAWSDVVKDLGRKPTIQMATRVGVGSDGSITIVWRDADSTSPDPARIYAASFAPAKK